MWAQSKVGVLKTHRLYGTHADLQWQKYFGGISSACKEADLTRCETDNLTKKKGKSLQDSSY